MTLEDQLIGSLAVAQARKAVVTTEALPPGPVSEDPAGRLLLMPKPKPPDSEIPRVMSPSSLNTFLDCQARWFYKKVLKLEETRGAALGLGTAVHTAITENMRQKIETREDLDVPGTQAIFINALIEQLDEIKLEPDESADELKDTGELLVRVFMERAAPAIEPAAVEELVEGRIGDVDVHGFIDIRTVDGRVIDVKTAKKKASGISAANLNQLTTYAMLHPEASGEVQILTLTKTKTVALDSHTLTLTPGHKRLTERLYSIARDQMQAGVYSPSRSSYLCSKRHCGYHARCVEDFGGEVSA